MHKIIFGKDKIFGVLAKMRFGRAIVKFGRAETKFGRAIKNKQKR